MKFRRHHNNKGYSLIKSGKLKEQAKELERKLGIKKDNSEVSVELPVGMPPLQLNEIYNGDSFELCKRVPAKTVDLILEDMPYNTTACEWDVKIDLQLYWETRLRILKPTGVVILSAIQPFTTRIIASNFDQFKYELIWEKSNAVNFLHANRMPLRAHENILIFYNNGNTYNPQKYRGDKISNKTSLNKNGYGNNYNTTKFEAVQSGGAEDRFPRSVIQVYSVNSNEIQHPTQKPVGLFEYLIRTYTNENDLVFDGFGGSGTTAIAAHKSKRNFIVIEKEKKYFDLATRRLDIERAQYTML